MSLRRIFLLSGARSEYDILAPVARALAASKRIHAAFIVAGPNLSPFHGAGVAGVTGDGFDVAGRVESFLSSDSWEGRSLSFANLVEGLTRLIAANTPDILVVAGDREEALAGAIVGNMLRVPVAHLHGGDRCVASELDEVLRPAISKLAHLHFTATPAHLERLVAMGERRDRAWCTGAPGLDRLLDEPDVADATLTRELGLDVSQPFFLVIQHPASTMSTRGYEEMRELLGALMEVGRPVLCSYPNTDPGNVGIRRAIDEAASADARIRPFTVLPRSRFVAVYRRAAAIVGNSSSIVIESGFLRVPGILVGPRQDLREVGPNVVRVPIEAGAIRRACVMALEDDQFRRAVREAPSIYGDGRASARVADVLSTIELPPDLLLKVMTY